MTTKKPSRAHHFAFLRTEQQVPVWCFPRNDEDGVVVLHQRVLLIFMPATTNKIHATRNISENLTSGVLEIVLRDLGQQFLLELRSG